VEGALATTGVDNQLKRIELNVTDYVNAQLQGNKTVSFLIKDVANKNTTLQFNSKESSNNKPMLIIK